ncbi:MAG: HAD family phosphatase [Planctomycetota bacterium]|jgi:putative hydrolase of the HAD superfamily|nr:HAD family phosphatase [Planctomycetota bacterium]
MATIRAVIFDLGRVLVTIDPSRAAARFPQLRLDEIIKFSAADDPQFQAFNRGEITPEKFHVALCDQFGVALSFAEFYAAWTGIFSPMPGMRELAGELRDAGKVKLGLLSDTDPWHWEFIGREFPWIKETFLRPTLSFQTGVLKPAAAAFLRAAANVDEPPENCLFIDDRADNVAGARAVGMSAVQFRDAATLRRELSLKTP